MRDLILLTCCCWTFSGSDEISPRVVGGSLTTIEAYPSAAVILHRGIFDTVQLCGGAIVNEKNVITAAHCFLFPSIINPNDYVIRVGSSMAHSGGILHRVFDVIIHPNFNTTTIDNDIAIMQTTTDIKYSKGVQPARLAGMSYQIKDNQPVMAIGWGYTEEAGPSSEQLRHVNVYTINTDVCRIRFRNHVAITDNMLCTGLLDVGGHDQCRRDSGSPVYHNGTVVGLSSMGVGCGRAYYPGINARVSRFSEWISYKLQHPRFLYPPKPKSARISFNMLIS